ncbi:MAG: Asp-tRNA(Asn)/Glu-tRNA(Gln) amidotransferase subunit GatC [Armatimonadota bacterium]
MPEVTREDILHVSKLARLALSDDEIDRLVVEVNRIMEHFVELQELDTANVPVTSHAIPMKNVWRDDTTWQSLPVEDVVANAPDGIEGFFRTSLFMETEE